MRARSPCTSQRGERLGRAWLFRRLFAHARRATLTFACNVPRHVGTATEHWCPGEAFVSLEARKDANRRRQLQYDEDKKALKAKESKAKRSKKSAESKQGQRLHHAPTLSLSV